MCCLQGTHFRPRDRYKVRGWEKALHANGNQKKAGAAKLVSDKTDYKGQGRPLHSDEGVSSRRRCNNCKYLCTQQRSASTHRADTNSVKKSLTGTQNREGLLWQTPRQSANKEAEALNDTLDQMDWTGIYGTLRPNSSRTPSPLNCTPYILQRSHISGRKSSLGKLEENWNHIIMLQAQCCEIRNQLQRQKTMKNKKTRRLNDMLLNHQWITEVKEEIKRCLETNENINMIIQNLWDAAKAVPWGKFTVLPRKQDKSQIT